MKAYTALLFVSLTFVTSLVSADVKKERELQDILQKHAHAMGGLRNWNKVESIRTTGTIERDGQLVDFCIIKKRPNQIRATITIPMPGNEEQLLQVIRAHDGREAWTATRIAGGETLAKQPLTGDHAADLIEEAQVLPQLMHLWQTNAKVELTGVQTYEGKVHHIITATHKTSPDKRYEFYLSSDSHLVSKSIIYKQDQVISTTEHSNLTPISGITVAKTLHLNSPVTGPSLMQVEDVTVGVGIYEEYFEGEQLQTASLSSR